MKRFITLKILLENNACKPRYKHLVEQLGADWKDDYPLTLSQILEFNGPKDCLWAFRCFGEDLGDVLKLVAVKVAVFAAKKVLHIFTKHASNPDDDRPAKAIEAAENYLANPTKETAANAADAAYVAADATYAATYAANAAIAATYAANAAYAYAYAAIAVSDAIAAYAYAYADSDHLILGIKNYLQELLIELSL